MQSSKYAIKLLGNINYKHAKYMPTQSYELFAPILFAHIAENNVMIDNIRTDMRKYANKEYALHHSKFFQTHIGGYGEGDIFLGLRVPHMHKIAKAYYLHTPCDSLAPLFNSELHEERFMAFDILVYKMKRAASKGDCNTDKPQIIYNTYIDNISAANNWDIVDLSAKDISGYYWYHMGTKIEMIKIDTSKVKKLNSRELNSRELNSRELNSRELNSRELNNREVNIINPNTGKLWEFANSDKLWLERIAIVSTYYFIKNKRYYETLQLAVHFKEHKHDLIHKAVGWMLREVGKQDEGVLLDFLDTHANQLPRTTLRYSIERLTHTQRKIYLSK